MVGWEGWDCGGGGVDGGWLRVKLPTNANRPAPRNAMTMLRDTEDSNHTQRHLSRKSRNDFLWGLTPGYMSKQ